MGATFLQQEGTAEVASHFFHSMHRGRGIMIKKGTELLRLGSVAGAGGWAGRLLDSLGWTRLASSKI